MLSTSHQEFCNSATLPSFISSGRHRVEQIHNFAGSLSKTTLVLYIVNPKDVLTQGNDILPIANLD